MAAPTVDAVAYFSGAAAEFHDSYSNDANRKERLAVWRGYFDRFLEEAGFAYDLGCGSGILACELGRRGMQIMGLDGAPGMLAIARRSASEAGLQHVRFREQRLPVANPARWRSADAVIASSALEYLDSLPQALASVREMLRPGGVLLFSVSNRQSVSRTAVRAVHFLTRRPAYVGLLRQFCTPASLRADLAATGFETLATEYFARADRVNRALGRLLPPVLASNMIIAAARRVG